MAYSKAFREGLEDAVAKTRWRMETHLRSHLLPHPEDSPATRADLSKSLVVLHDALENFVTEAFTYLEGEFAKAPAKPGVKSGATSRRKPAAAKRRRR